MHNKFGDQATCQYLSVTPATAVLSLYRQVPDHIVHGCLLVKLMMASYFAQRRRILHLTA